MSDEAQGPGWSQASDGKWYPPPQWPPPPPFGVPQPRGPAWVVAPVTSGLAIASLVLSILWLGGLGSVLAVIFGIIALSQIKQSQGRKTGSGLAVAGLIIGVVGICGIAGWVLLLRPAIRNTATASANGSVSIPTNASNSYFSFALPSGWTEDAGEAAHGIDTIVDAHPNGSSSNLLVGRSDAGSQVLASVGKYRSSIIPAILARVNASLTSGPVTTSVDHAPAVEFKYKGTSGGDAFVGEQIQTVRTGHLYIITTTTAPGDTQMPAALRMALSTWAWR